jgi:hypothetical protein
MSHWSPLWSGTLVFHGSVLRYFGYYELEGEASCCSSDREVPKHENPKIDGGVVWSQNSVTHFDISRFVFSTILRTRNQVLRHWKPWSLESGILLEWNYGHTFWQFRVQLSKSYQDNEPTRLVLVTPKSQNAMCRGEGTSKEFDILDVRDSTFRPSWWLGCGVLGIESVEVMKCNTPLE